MTAPSKTSSHADHADNSPVCLDPRLTARAEEVVDLLTKRKLTIVTAESCTAGLIAAALSLADGASTVLHGGFVTYTKENKTSALGVSADLLRKNGSVNAEVAAELARGALARSPADLALAITGVLGPKPDEDGNPVGLIYFCCRGRSGYERTLREDFGKLAHDRLRFLAVVTAFDLIKEACETLAQA